MLLHGQGLPQQEQEARALGDRRPGQSPGSATRELVGPWLSLFISLSPYFFGYDLWLREAMKRSPLPCTAANSCKQAGGHPALRSGQLVTGTSPRPVQGSNPLETGVGVQAMGRAQQEPCLSHLVTKSNNSELLLRALSPEQMTGFRRCLCSLLPARLGKLLNLRAVTSPTHRVLQHLPPRWLQGLKERECMQGT